MRAALLAELWDYPPTIRWATVRYDSVLLPCAYSCHGIFHGIVLYLIFIVLFYMGFICLYMIEWE